MGSKSLLHCCAETARNAFAAERREIGRCSAGLVLEVGWQLQIPQLPFFVRVQVPEGEMPCVRRIGRAELGQQLLEVGLDFGEGELPLLPLLNARQGQQKQQGLVRCVPGVRSRSPAYVMEQLSDLICAKEGLHNPGRSGPM